jgi:hypothetical protein
MLNYSRLRGDSPFYILLWAASSVAVKQVIFTFHSKLISEIHRPESVRAGLAVAALRVSNATVARAKKMATTPA